MPPQGTVRRNRPGGGQFVRIGTDAAMRGPVGARDAREGAAGGRRQTADERGRPAVSGRPPSARLGAEAARGAGEPRWRGLGPVARGIVLLRAVRSLGQGLLVVDFVLYLHALGWSAAAIGALLSASGIVGAAIVLGVGVLSDRMGRRPFIVAYECLLLAGTTAVVVDHSAIVIALAATVLGLGRGANGAAGPFGPAEQAWLARHTPAHWRGWTFSLNSAAGFFGMGVGALAAGLIALGVPHLPVVARYNVVFVFTLGVAAVNLLQALLLPERGPEADDGAETGPREARPSAPSLDRAGQDRALTLVLLINAVNSVGIGLAGPLIPYWFAVRFGAGPATIGPIYALSFVLTGAASLVTGRWSARAGLVASVVWPRLLGVLAMVAMALSPTYALASGLYIVRSMLNRGSTGARQAFSLGLVGDERRGLAASLTGLSMRLPSALGTAVGGVFFAAGAFTAPFVLASTLQLVFVILYATVLRPYQGVAQPATEAAGEG